MVIYEVNLDVEGGIAAEYERWLAAHVQEMLEIDGFFRARWYERLPNDEGRAGEDVKLWTVQYDVYTREQLDDYFRRHAARMRGEGIERFGDRFSASRRILTPRSLGAPPAE